MAAAYLTSLDNGRPYPNPAIGALKSLPTKFESIDAASIVVCIYVQIRGKALQGIPPPSSDILTVMSSSPSTTITLMGGKYSLSWDGSQWGVLEKFETDVG
jgi:hypothetical protein